MMRATNVTFLFTDLVGSTRILDRVGDRAGEELMRLHFDMLRTAITHTDGHLVKTLGDGVMAIFRRAADAVGCATAMQHGVAAHNVANPEVELAMRVGVHSGAGIRMGGDYYGIPVIIAKRLCDHCVGGQVLMSNDVRTTLTSAGTPVEVDDLGMLGFKGLSEAVPTVELRWEQHAIGDFGGRRVRPAPRARSTAAPALCGPGEPRSHRM